MEDTYGGTTERLVLCLDISTTCTGATMLYLKPGALPVARTVTTWPGGDQQSSKVPTTMLYHKSKPMAFGAECLEDDIREQASRGGWEEAKHFKLAVHPKATIQTTEGRTATLCIADGFNPRWVRTPGSIDIIKNAFTELWGRSTDNKNDVLQGVEWELTGTRNERYKFKGQGDR